MVDTELERIAFNNPALTASAAHRVPISRQRSNEPAKQASTPSGETQRPEPPPKLTKYDVRSANAAVQPMSFKLTISGRLAKGSEEFLSQLVQRNNGHWGSLFTPHYYSIQI